MTKPRTIFAIAILFAINAMNFFDRNILGAVGELVRKDWQLSDTQMGWLGTSFTLLYAVVGVPLGRWADRGNRSRILAAGVFVWSLLTAASGMATSFLQLFLVRLGVGVGEATCAPAATSLIGDLVPSTGRAKALSIFMLGLPVGIALSYLVSGIVAHDYGWQTAFYVAGIPGLFCAVATLWITEPARGATEVHDIGAARRAGSPYLLVLSTPTILWLIVSGALHNFNMYAIAAFLSPFLMRFHGLDVREAGLNSMFIYGLSGIPGLFIGGWLGDRVRRSRTNGRMLVGAFALLLSVPLVYLALGCSAGDTRGFFLLMGAGCGVMYVYYSTVYSTLQDVVEPSLRGTAMALYFCAMYVFGASLGPIGTGFLSDYFALQAAAEAGVAVTNEASLTPFRAAGLHSAMYAIPVLGIVLAAVLLAASRTVTKDMERLQRWMRESVQTSSGTGKASV
jgi:MFS family permease